ncbi:WD40-like domain-containing protein [Tieghemostelium lacteum]|uniref:PAN2-PAN3 deadenylation complex catalytic subunit PAN2 n=1 Tax=Tieghemostelium lacteum TaxID=361077 RepID=A0A151ZF55_TIELA|nr:WD40-like domain-containing protein [Tieghemostelium lacteum]|eukprot:KYQ92601.1 WD40-like domain-containing protein [Tieghemostelium lacteum]
MYGPNNGYNLRNNNISFNNNNNNVKSPITSITSNNQTNTTPPQSHGMPIYGNYHQEHLVSPNQHQYQQNIYQHQPTPTSMQSPFSTTNVANISNNNNNNNNSNSTQQMYNEYAYQDDYPPEDDYYDDITWAEMRIEPEYPISNINNIVTTLRFDPWEELLWVGYQNGKVSSLLNPNLERYSSFYASQDKTEIRDILVDSEGALCLTKSSLNFYTRGGAPNYQVRNERMKDLNAVQYSKFDNSEIIVGNDHGIIFIIDFYTGKVIREIHMPSGIKTINRGRQIWCGQTNGDLSMLDQRTWRIEHTFSAHKGDVKSVDIKGDLMVSCGCSPRLGQLFLDPIIKVFDTNALRALPPIQYKRPTMVKFHPKYYSSIAISSDSTNQIFICDVNNQNDTSNSQYLQVDSLFGYLYSMDISSSGDIMAFGDGGGLVHQWTETEEFSVNVNSFQTDLVQFPQFNRPNRMTENSPLSEIPFQQDGPDQYLLSYWKPTLSYQVGLPQRPLNSTLLANLKQHDFVGYIPNTGANKISRKQMRGKSYEEGKIKSLSNLSMSHIRPPKIFRWTELKFKKFGLEEFEVMEFNKTHFSGLENILPNSYSNCVIQALYFIPNIRAVLLNHLCTKSYCLSCELGFLFTMMDNSVGKTVESSNFLRVLKQIPQASALGIILSSETPESPIPLPQLVSNLNRFLVEQLHKEISTTSNINSETIFESLFSSISLSSNKCINCGNQYEKQLKQNQYELSYPTTPNEYGQGPDGTSFSNILKNTLSKQFKSPAWCEKCQGFFSTVQKKTLKSLPPLLCINANCIKKEQEEYWKFESTNIIPGTKTFISSTGQQQQHGPQSQLNGQQQQVGFNNNKDEITWLPLKIRIKLDSNNNQLSVTEYPNNLEKSKVPVNPQDLVEEVNENGQLYELTTCISHIKDQFKRIPKQGHLVSQIKIKDTSVNPPKDRWYLFNDFRINECSANDVTHFDSNWRTGAILYYSKVNSNATSDLPIPPIVNPISKDTYLQNNLITCKPNALTFTPANTNTLPKKDDLVAIDTEFVSIGPEETEVSLDGKRVIIQPGNFSLARVSIVRSNGEAFIDDYIQSIEPVTDYLTRFSGINVGDLDPKVSTKNVISLKNIYLKLRYLVDQKVKFVGHGLQKDFRIINIYVPPEQIIDTVELYQLKNQRKLSLRFLAFVLLKIDIQSETHCSVEDARTAMELYKYYLSLQEKNEFDETLKRIYEIGRQYNFKVPEGNVNLKDIEKHINNILNAPISQPQKDK